MDTFENSTLDLGIFETSNNSSNSTYMSGERDEELAKIEIAVLSLLFFLALFGNSVVLIVLKLKHTALTRMQLLIVYLSVTDISVALFHILPTTINKIFFYFPNDISVCRIYNFITVAELYASSFVLIVTALDRYISICHPLTAHIWTNKRVHMMTVGAWLCALLCSTPQFNVKLYKYGRGYLCHPNISGQLDILAYSWWAFCSVFFVPLLLLIFFYGRICYVVWQSMRGRECVQSISNNTSSRYIRKTNKCRISSQPSDNQVKKYSNMHDKNAVRNPRAICQGVSKSKMKTIKLTFSVVACFIACYTPFFTAILATSYESKLMEKESEYLTSAINYAISLSHTHTHTQIVVIFSIYPSFFLSFFSSSFSISVFLSSFIFPNQSIFLFIYFSFFSFSFSFTSIISLTMTFCFSSFLSFFLFYQFIYLLHTERKWERISLTLYRFFNYLFLNL